MAVLATKIGSKAVKVAVRRLLGWYDIHKRKLPWRSKTPDPYHVWLSEIMLQQTTVAAVASYYKKFTARWPQVQDLAAAPLDDLLAAWSGLGYYARARNLHKAAGIVAASGGAFPNTIEGLSALPGVGPYTAGAIGAIAFGLRAAAVDANAERVIARFFAVREPIPAARPEIRKLADTMVPADRPGDFAQSLMDLGSMVCTQKPVCSLCPLAADCRGYALGDAEKLPQRAAKAPKPKRKAVAYVAEDADGRVLLMQRPPKGLLGGMWQPPMTPLENPLPDAGEIEAAKPFVADWQKVTGTVRHVFTHFELEVDVWQSRLIQTDGRGGNLGRWQPVDRLSEVGLPTVMRKILHHAFSSGTVQDRSRAR